MSQPSLNIRPDKDITKIGKLWTNLLINKDAKASTKY